MTGAEQYPDAPTPATEPMDVAYRAAMEALSTGVDMAEWFVQLIAAVAVSDNVLEGDTPLLRRPGSWEAAGVGDLIESAGAHVHPETHRRTERPLLSDMAVTDVIRWAARGARELYGDDVAARVEQAAGATDAAWRAKLTGNDDG